MSRLNRILCLSPLLFATLSACGDSRSVPQATDGRAGQDGALRADGPRLDGGPVWLDAEPYDGNLIPPDSASGCPTHLPTQGAACNGSLQCTYEQPSGCPCGPASSALFCACQSGQWACYGTGACMPCADAQPLTDASMPPDLCPMLPSCNWCGGSSNYDSNGCVTGWTCSNGVDPCQTQPCVKDTDCPINQICDSADMLCWPIPPAQDAGPTP